MTKAAEGPGDVDGPLYKFISRTWKKQGSLVKEIWIGHLKGGGAPDIFAVIPKELFDSYADNRSLCRELEDRMAERAEHYPDVVRFEIQLFGGDGVGVRPLDSQQFQRQGKGRPPVDTLDTTPTGQLTMYMREAHRDRELTITTLQRHIEKSDARYDRLHQIVDTMMARYPELLDLMSKLADGEVERDIRRRQAFRIEGLKDRALQRLDQAFPLILSAATGGKLNLLGAGAPAGTSTEMMAQIEPHLLALIKSLANAGERGLQIGALLTQEEQGHLMAIGATIEQFEAKAKEKKTEEEIKVKQSTNGKKDDPGAAPAS